MEFAKLLGEAGRKELSKAIGLSALSRNEQYERSMVEAIDQAVQSHSWRKALDIIAIHKDRFPLSKVAKKVKKLEGDIGIYLADQAKAKAQRKAAVEAQVQALADRKMESETPVMVAEKRKAVSHALHLLGQMRIESAARRVECFL